MPGRLFLTRSRVAVGPYATPDLLPRRSITPGETLWVLTSAGFREMRWGLIPSGRRNARGRPVLDTIVNARGETVFDKRAFMGLRRGALPVDGWIEWTGEAGCKRHWEVAAAGGAVLWMAVVWDVWHAPGGQALAQCATVTCPTNAKLRDLQGRMGVLLDPGDLSLWLEGSEAQARGLIAPAPETWLSLREVPQEVPDGAVPRDPGPRARRR